jgi:hypothetical protein
MTPGLPLLWTLGGLVLAAPAAPPPPAAAPALARLTYVERAAEHGDAGAWREAREGGTLRIGERLRTPEGALLHVDFPWMALTLSASSTLEFPDSAFLQGVLGRGRVALLAERQEILKLRTDEAEVRGRGRVVVRRRDGGTLVSTLAGRFSVEGADTVVSMSAGTGTIVAAGGAPAPAVPLPAAPDGLAPGRDPIYVAPGDPIRLRWNGRAAAYRVEVLAVGSETVLLERDVREPALELAIRWPGAFRWRVASVDPRGLEGPPSADGFFCVDDAR